MVARKMYEIKKIPINIATLDPVHMSGGHGEVEKLPSTVVKYQSIIMENENSTILKAVFPFQFVDCDGEDNGRVYYINMPGKHGSGTQLTSAIGKVCYELIANFMRKRGTRFESPPRTAFQMCELFAEIHRENGWTDPTRTARTIFDDDGHAIVHNRGNVSSQDYKLRANSVKDALQRNLKFLGRESDQKAGGRNRKDPFMAQFGNKSYFINQKHAKFFKKGFPHMWRIIAYQNKISAHQFLPEYERMRNWPALRASLPLLLQLLESRMPDGFILEETLRAELSPRQAPSQGADAELSPRQAPSQGAD